MASGKSYRTLGDIDACLGSSAMFNGDAHRLEADLRNRRPSDPTWNNAR